jgi:hypothetical protein
VTHVADHDDDPLLLARRLMTALDWTRAGDEGYIRGLARQLTQDPGADPGAATLLGRTAEAGDGESRREVDLAKRLFGIGRGEEAMEVLSDVRPRLLDDPDAACYLRNVLVANGHADTALRWLTAALTRLLDENAGGATVPDAATTEVIVAVHAGRYALRRELGLPVDSFDEVVEDLGDPEDGLDGSDGTAWVFWPRGEFATLLRRWPELASRYGTDWDEHRASVERGVSDAATGGDAVFVVAGAVEGLLATAAFADAPPTDPQVCERYEDEAVELGEAVPWPPQLAEPCWCRSGQAYEKCCHRRGVQATPE